MSQTNVPLVHQVIPLFDGITRALDDHASNSDYAPAVRMAAARGHTMLNKYYGLTDDSVVYRIAMCALIIFILVCYSHVSIGSASSAIQVNILSESWMAT